MEGNIVNLNAPTPEYEKALATATERLRDLIESAVFLDIVARRLPAALYNGEVRLMPGRDVAEASIAITGVDTQAMCNVRHEIGIVIRMVEEPLVEPVTTNLILPGDVSPSSLLLPKDRLH